MSDEGKRDRKRRLCEGSEIGETEMERTMTAKKRRTERILNNPATRGEDR